MPVVDAVASQYQDEVAFVAVAGRSSPPASAERVGVWFDPERISWGYDDSIWELYGVRGQPVTIVIDDGVIVDQWFGIRSEADIRALLDGVITG